MLTGDDAVVLEMMVLMVVLRWLTDTAGTAWPRLQGGFFFRAQTLGADVHGMHGGLTGAGGEGGGSGRRGAELRHCGGGQAGGGGDGDDGDEDGFHVFSDVHDGVL